MIINAKKFQSGFAKEDLERTVINFPSIYKSVYIKTVSNILSSIKSRERFFYIYYRGLDKEINSDLFAKHLAKALL